MINVIGGGPVGSYFSSLVKGDVKLFEEHKAIGKPVACTGIVTKAILELVKLEEGVVINELDKVRVVGPNQRAEFSLKNKELVIDRAKFDKCLFEGAVDRGVEVCKEHKFLGCKKGKLIFKNKNKIKKYDKGILVGADGPYSSVGRESGLLRGRKYLVGKQYRVKMKNEANVFTVFFGGVPGFFGWVVPENEDMARIGVASEKNVDRYFDLLVKELRLGKKNFKESQSGVIPIYDPKFKTCGDNMYLLGDAAGHVKASTGGGLVYGLRGARCLAKALGEGLDYERLWRKEFGKDLGFHLRVRKFLNKLDRGEWDRLISILKGVDLGKYERDNVTVSDI